MDLVARRAIEKRIVIAAAEGLIAAGCSVSVVEGEKVFLVDSTDPIAIDVALHASGEPGFLVKRVIDGTLQEGWVDFVGAAGIEVTADENLKVYDALQIANALAVQLEVQRIVTTSDGTETPVLMAPPGHGAGVAVIIPNLLPKGSLSASRKRGYTKPSPWPSK